MENHPGPLESCPKIINSYSENILLRRLQNFNISQDDTTEFWTIQEQKTLLNEQKISSFNYNNAIHDEIELYVKGNTAVWYKQMYTKTFSSTENATSFSCESPIKHAFFCSANFIKSNLHKITTNIKKNRDKKSKIKNNKIYKKDDLCVCLIDSSCLKVYSEDSEDYTATLDFPISNAWATKFGVIFEKEPLSTIIENQSINLPRVFSLSHPLEEIRPVLLKYVESPLNYFSEADFRIIFTTWNSDLILLYDHKNCIHFICKIRKVTEVEIEMVNQLNETNISGLSYCNTQSRIQSELHSNSIKFNTGINKCHQSSIQFGRSYIHNTVNLGGSIKYGVNQIKF